MGKNNIMKKIIIDDFYEVIHEGSPWFACKSKEIGPRIGDVRVIDGKLCYCYVVHECISVWTGRVKSCECCWSEIDAKVLDRIKGKYNDK